MLSSRAVVSTDKSKRYAKQLASHLGHKIQVDELPNGHRLTIATGSAELLPEQDRLMLTATAPDEDTLARVQDVVARHLVRFGQKDELVVNWDMPTAAS
jgi:hypothetical protein